MVTGLAIQYKGDLSNIFKPLLPNSVKRADVNLKVPSGQDISALFEPTNGSDQINFDTGYIVLSGSGYVDIRYLFQRFEYTPQYFVLPVSFVVNEGGTITINVDVTDVPDGTQVCYYTSSDSDFVNPTGVITIQNATASFNLTLKSDQTTEGVETFKVYLKHCTTNAVLAESVDISIQDISRTPPTYSILTTSVEVNEGGTVTYNVITTDVDDQEVLYYSTSSDTDFVTPTGSVTIVGNKASFTLTVKNDLTTEGPETFSVYLKLSATGLPVATSNIVTIKDTSRTPSTYTIIPDKTTVAEGGTVIFTVTTTDVDNGTVLYYVASLSDDITPSTGSITINSNTATFTLTVKEDMLVELNESFTVAVKTLSTTGTTVKTSASVAITTDCFKGSSKLSEITTNPLGTTPVSFGNFGPGRYVIEYVGGAHSLWDATDRWLIGTFTLKAGSTSKTIGDPGVYTSAIVESKGREWNNSFNVFQHTGGDITLTMIDNPLTDNRIHPTYGAARYAIYDYTCGNPPVYSISSDKSTVVEGDSIIVTVNTTGVADGTVLFYNTTSDADFDTPTGQITVYGNTARFNLTVTRDKLYEATETFVINLRRGGINGVIAASSSSVTILPTTSVYTIVANKAIVSEGSSVIFTITTTDVQNGTILYYSTSSDADFNDPTGQVTINSNTGQFTLNVKSDLIFEGTELFTVTLKTGSQNGTTILTSGSITLIDAQSTYSSVANKLSVKEGESVTLTVTTTDVQNGTILYYSTSSDGDFDTPTGQVTINNNTGQFTLNVKSDLNFEGTELFTVTLKTGSQNGTAVHTSGSISITDAIATYQIVPNKAIVSEGETITFTITTTDVQDGTKLYITTTLDSDFNTFINEVTINNNTAGLTLTVKNDIQTEGDEYFTASASLVSVTGTIVCTSRSVQIRDVSKTPVYAIDAPTNVDEGGVCIFAIATTNVVDGTVLYYEVVNVTTSAADFTGNTSGSVITADSKASFSIAVKSDLTTEGSETFKANIRTVNNTGTIVATSPVVAINDISKTVPTYYITSSTVTVNEGDTVTFNITTTNISNGTVLYYNIFNTTTSSSDFTGDTSGSVSILNNSASFSVNIKADLTTEDTETFKARLLTGSSTGSVVATSASIGINDISRSSPTYSITPNKDVVYEGELVTFDVVTTNVDNGTVLSYDIPASNSLITSDTDINICIDGTSVGDATKAIIEDMVNVGVLKRMLLPVYNNNEAVYTDRVKTFITTGERTFGVEYLNRPRRNGTRVVNIAFQDESSKQSNISYQHTNNANYNADVPALRQAIVNEPGKLYGIVFQVEGEAGFKTFLQGVFAGTGVFSTVNLKNVSQIIPVYDVPTNANQLFYATKILDAFRTLGIISAGQFNSADINLSSGSVQVQNNKASFNITATNDILPEIDESFVANLRTANNNIVRTSSSVTIKDSRCYKGSKVSEVVTTPRSNIAATFGNSSYEKGKYVIEYVGGAHSFWSSGDAWSFGSFRVVTGDVTSIVSNPVEVGFIPYKEFTTTSGNIEDVGRNWFGEGQPYYILIDHPGGYLGLAISDNPVSDNRIHPNGASKYNLHEFICGTPKYSVAVPAAVDEGISFTFNINTTDVPNDTVLYFEGASKLPTSFNNDVLGYSQTSATAPRGNVTVNNNQASGILSVNADFKTEGEEKFYIIFRTSYPDGPEVLRSSEIKINDTSIPPTYTIQPGVSEINEGESVTFNIATSNVADGTQLSYKLSRTDVTPDTGTVTVNSNKASFTVTAKTNLDFNKVVSFSATLKKGIEVLVTSNVVTVKSLWVSPLIAQPRVWAAGSIFNTWNYWYELGASAFLGINEWVNVPSKRPNLWKELFGKTPKSVILFGTGREVIHTVKNSPKGTEITVCSNGNNKGPINFTNNNSGTVDNKQLYDSTQYKTITLNSSGDLYVRSKLTNFDNGVDLEGGWIHVIAAKF